MTSRKSTLPQSQQGGAFAVAFALAIAAPAITAQTPYTGASISSVTPTGDDRYTIRGAVFDQHGDPACALALASGKCMFTCGAGSLRCEGGSVNLPFGQFELISLPKETDGSIRLQAFVQGHVSYTTQIFPGGAPADSARWGAYNSLCCNGSAEAFTVTIDGVSKRSVSASCDTDATWEGWAVTSPGTKTVSFSLDTSSCGAGWQSSFDNPVPFKSGDCTLIEVYFDAGEIFAAPYAVDCSLLP